MPNGNKIERLLNDRGMTQYELAKRAGISETYMSTIMNKNKNVTEKTLFRICEVLGCEAEDIRNDG